MCQPDGGSGFREGKKPPDLGTQAAGYPRMARSRPGGQHAGDSLRGQPQAKNKIISCAVSTRRNIVSGYTVA